MKKQIIVLLWICLAFLGKSASAQSVSTGADSFHYLDYDNRATVTSSPSDTVFHDDYPQYSGYAEGNAAYGHVGAAVSYTDSNDTWSYNNVSAFIAAYGLMDDKITILGGTGSGTLVMNIGIDGTQGSNAASYLSPSFYTYVSTTNLSTNTTTYDLQVTNGSSSTSSAGNYQTTAIPFTFGVAFDLRIYMSSELDIGHTQAPGIPITAFCSYLNTASWNSATVQNSQGNIVSSPTITGASGTVYPVPEPSSISMLLISAGCCAASARRRCASR